MGWKEKPGSAERAPGRQECVNIVGFVSHEDNGSKQCHEPGMRKGPGVTGPFLVRHRVALGWS